MPRSPKRKDRMVLITFHIPEPMLRELDRLVEEGRYPSRSEAIRVAIRDLILRERGYKSSDNIIRALLG